MPTTTCTSKTSRSTKSSVPLFVKVLGGVPLFVIRPNKKPTVRSLPPSSPVLFPRFTLGVYYKQNPNLVLIQNCQTKERVDFPPVYGTLNEIQLLREQQTKTKPRGGFQYLPFSVTYTSFWQEYDALIKNCHTKVYRGFFASLRYIERKISCWPHIKTKRGIPIYRLLSRYTFFWQKYDINFHFDLVFEDVRVFQ